MVKKLEVREQGKMTLANTSTVNVTAESEVAGGVTLRMKLY